MFQDNKGWGVAHWLSFYSDKTNWSINNKKILMLQDNKGRSVANILAKKHPTWTTNDPEILNLKNKKKKNFRKCIKRK